MAAKTTTNSSSTRACAAMRAASSLAGRPKPEKIGSF